jgi:hypothetical protein
MPTIVIQYSSQVESYSSFLIGFALCDTKSICVDLGVASLEVRNHVS